MTAESIALPQRPPRRRGAKVGRPPLLLVLAGLWLALLALFAIAAPLVAGDPDTVAPLARLAMPATDGHLLGTDELGRDLFARLVYGTRYSLAFGLVPAAFALLIGGSLGLVAGYAGRIVNLAVMRLLDVFYTFPPVLIALAVVGVLGPGFINCLVALTIYLVPPVARLMESATAQISTTGYVEAARLSGASSLAILTGQVLPNALPQVMAYLTSVLGVMIVIGAGLSFLGLGVSAPTPEWGSMMNELRTAMFFNPVVAALPGSFIFLTSMSLNIVGEAAQRMLSSIKRT